MKIFVLTLGGLPPLPSLLSKSLRRLPTLTLTPRNFFVLPLEGSPALTLGGLFFLLLWVLLSRTLRHFKTQHFLKLCPLLAQAPASAAPQGDLGVLAGPGRADLRALGPSEQAFSPDGSRMAVEGASGSWVLPSLPSGPGPGKEELFRPWLMREAPCQGHLPQGSLWTPVAAPVGLTPIRALA